MSKFLLAALALGLLTAPLRAADSPAPAPTAASESIANGSVLPGKWQRPDGGYVIEIVKVDSTGSLDANYFNPRPIRVAGARWRFAGERLQLRVDLQDTGYEGAYYLLFFDSASNQLRGEYHTAGGEVYEVTFDRLPPSA